MKPFTSKDIIDWIDKYLADPRLEPEELLRKRWAWIWLVVTFIGSLFSILLFLFVFKHWPLWYYGVAFSAAYFVAFPLYRRLKRFDLVLNILFSFFIIDMFFGMLHYGGIPNNMGLIFIGINCAVGSTLVGNLRWTVGIFILYCVTIILMGILQPYLLIPDFVTPESNTIAFVMLAVWINACLLFLVILFMKDKSRYEHAEAENLRKLDEAKTHLYTNVSHEFRTPLTVIQGIAEQLEQKSDNQLRTEPRKIKMQSQILLRLVNQMLDIARLEAGGMSLNKICGDINKFIQYVSSSFYSLTESQGIELNINCGKEPIYTDFDPEKLRQVLSNLITNAVKFTPDGGIITIEVYSESIKKQENVKIHIRDSGFGIPEESLEHIFDRFYQVPDNYHQISGTGLGLSLTREILKLMKGNISVHSEHGKGSEFIVNLPVTKKAPRKEDHGISLIHPGDWDSTIAIYGTESNDDVRPKIAPGKPILLVVEDNRSVVEYLVSILEDHYIVELASNGVIGLEKALKIIPDIILTDVMMPQMDGFELIRELKKDILTDHIPVVVLTAKADSQSKLNGLSIGADHYLVKPFSEKELLLKLSNILKARNRMQEKLGALPLNSSQERNQYRQEILFMAKLDSILHEQFSNKDFGIKDICSSLHISRSQLYRKFTALTDKSIGNYIRSFRLHKAKNMLENQGKNVTEAALDSGFKNLSHFSTSFREEFGTPPSDLL